MQRQTGCEHLKTYQTMELEKVCAECGEVVHIVDAFELELVRGGAHDTSMLSPLDFTERHLGSVMGLDGPPRIRGVPVTANHVASTGSTLWHLKNRQDALIEHPEMLVCCELTSRVCDHLHLPSAVLMEAMSITKKAIALIGINITTTEVSAYSVIAACKRMKILSSSVRTIVQTYKDMGHRVKFGALMTLNMDAPVRMEPIKAVDYMPFVMGKISAPLVEMGYPYAYMEVLRSGALVLLNSVEQRGHNPIAFCATAIYATECILAKSDRRMRTFPQWKIAGWVGVAEYTIREQYVELFKGHVKA